MPHPTDTPVLDGPRARLRSFAPADVEGRRRCGRDPEIMAMFGGTPDFSTPVPMTVAEAQEWYDEVSADPNPYHWAIEHRGRFVGTTRLHSLRGQDHKAQFAIGLLARDVWGIGLGSEATRLVLHHAFAELGLHRVGLKVFAHNTRAIACYRACGFVEEGREREAAYVGGAWRDDVIMGILAHELR